jgi:hypothetical protein
MRKFAILLTALLLTACQEAPQNYTLTPISFSQQAPIRIDVARVNIIEDYKPTFKRPNVEHEFATSPMQAVRTWANERIQPVGQNGSLEVIIKEASVREVELPKSDGFRGFVTDDQSERYDAVLEVTLRLYDGVNPLARHEGSVTVTRSKSINEKATIADRELLWHNMVRDMMATYDKEAELRLRRYFVNYLR